MEIYFRKSSLMEIIPPILNCHYILALHPTVLHAIGGLELLTTLRLYDKALTAQEIKTISDVNIYNDNTVSDGLVGYWKLNGNLNDDSKYHNHGKMFTPLSSMVFTPDGKMFFSEKNTGK